MNEIIEMIGKEAGPVSMVMAGVHGNERGGVNVLNAWLPKLTIDCGTVLFAYGNPLAIAANKRQTDANLNRMFKPDDALSELDKLSYEYERAQFLKTYLDKADALLDIHSSTTPDSKPFIICEANAKNIVERLPIERVVSGFDAVEPGGTDYYMNANGKIGVCVECGFYGDEKSYGVAERCMFQFLSERGHMANTEATRNITQTYIHMNKIYITQTDRFVLTKAFADFEEIASGQLIAMDGAMPVHAKEEAVIIFPTNCNKAGEEGFLLGQKNASFEK